MSNREVMQQALILLDSGNPYHPPLAANMLRKALEQPEQEPAQTFYQPAANEAVEILKSLGYVYEPTYTGTGLAWVAKKSAQPEQEPVPVQHTHQWFSTGAMEPGQMRCIHCGVWGRDVSLSAQPQTPEPLKKP